MWMGRQDGLDNDISKIRDTWTDKAKEGEIIDNAYSSFMDHFGIIASYNPKNFPLALVLGELVSSMVFYSTYLTTL
jgi:delta 1-pyrroline-5-carboxylate dehydrogenase